jgi:hypothetical protein
MKRYLLPVALCFFWATPIQVSAAEVCPKGPITAPCEAHLKKNLNNGTEVVSCIREVQGGTQNPACGKVLDDALQSLPKSYRAGSDIDIDTSPARFIHSIRSKLPDS